MDFAIRDHLGQGSGPEARARELYPVNDIHLIHHLVTEDLDKVEAEMWRVTSVPCCG